MTFTLLDGGMGQELIHRWGRPATPLWSADIIRDAPGLVQAAHEDFLAAGAEIITVSAYTATPSRLAAAGRADEFDALHRGALAAATAAREAAAGSARIAGCLPPLTGSYRPEDRLSAEATAREYGCIVAAQADAVDLFLCETMPSVQEAALAARAAKAAGKPVWCALTVLEHDGTKLRSGEPLADGADAVLAEGADAVLINCSPPEVVADALAVLRDRAPLFGAYANGFTTVAGLAADTTVDLLSRREDLHPDAYADLAMKWAGMGAGIIGGCCEISPAHIAAIARRRAAS